MRLSIEGYLKALDHAQWISLGIDWQIGFEAEIVIALRMLRLAAGGARAEAEASRMVTEEILAAGEAKRTHGQYSVVSQDLPCAIAFMAMCAEAFWRPKVFRTGCIVRSPLQNLEKEISN